MAQIYPLQAPVRRYASPFWVVRPASRTATPVRSPVAAPATPVRSPAATQVQRLEMPFELASGIVVRIGSCQFVINEPLGMGSFGVVWAARCLDNHQDVAVKEITVSGETELQRAEYEIKLLRSLGELAPLPLRIPTLVSSEFEGSRVRLAMSRLPGCPLDNLFNQAPVSIQDAIDTARGLLEQLSPTMAAISKVTYHRDVNAHNILVQMEPEPSFGLVDFGLAVDASTWMAPSLTNPGGRSEWEFLDVGGDCRYWPVSAWRQFEAGYQVLTQEEPLCTEYQTHLDLQGLGLTALQVLTSLLPENKVPELKELQEAWRDYWQNASCHWAALLDTFRRGGDWQSLKQDFVMRKIHKVIASKLSALRTALSHALDASAVANLTGRDGWPSGSAGLFWALLSMVSSGEGIESSWEEVKERLRRAYVLPPAPSSCLAAATSPSRPSQASRRCRLKLLEEKVQALARDFEKFQPITA